MLKEFLDTILETHRKSLTPLEVTGDRKDCRIFLDSNLQEKVVVNPRSPIDIEVWDLTSFVEAVDHYVQETAPVVFVSALRVQAVLDDGEHWQNRISWPLVKSDESQCIDKLKDRSPRELIRTLRTTYRGADVTKLIGNLRKLDFTRRSDGKVVTEHGRESLGRSVEAAVQGVEAFPEEIKIPMKWWANSPFIEDFGCRFAVDIDCENQVISLLPMAGELDAMKAHCVSQLVDVLKIELEQRDTATVLAGQHIA